MSFTQVVALLLTGMAIHSFVLAVLLHRGFEPSATQQLYNALLLIAIVLFILWLGR